MSSPPAFRKVNPAGLPVLAIALMSDIEPLTRVDDYADTILVQKLSQAYLLSRLAACRNRPFAFR
jgi:multidrug efflux pump subunit AcrB